MTFDMPQEDEKKKHDNTGNNNNNKNSIKIVFSSHFWSHLNHVKCEQFIEKFLP